MINDKPSNWAITPNLKPDRLEVECTEQLKKVKFVTDIDSIEFAVQKGDTVRFYIVLNDKDSALTEIVGVSKNVNFSDQFKCS